LIIENKVALKTIHFKTLDRLVGSTLVRLFCQPAKIDVGLLSVSRLLVIRPGGIGDAVLLMPALRLLREKYPDAAIDILAEGRNAGAFALSGSQDEVFCYDRPGDLLKVFRRRYDLIIDTEQWHRLSSVLARALRPQCLIGFATNDRTRLLRVPVEYSHANYESESFLNLVAPLLGDTKCMPAEPFLTIPQAAAQTADNLLAPLAGPFVALFPGASIPERRWPLDKFSDLARQLQGQGLTVIVLGGDSERAFGEVVLKSTRGLNLAGATTLAETAAIIKRSILLVSGDSGVLHLAVGLGVPTVSLFGPGRALKWAPRGERHVVLNKNLPCSPCTTFGYTPTCHKNGRCISEITVDEVFEAVLGLLKTKKV
jgi:ADP-heptose:LPS heptosyltransferase